MRALALSILASGTVLLSACGGGDTSSSGGGGAGGSGGTGGTTVSTTTTSSSSSSTTSSSSSSTTVPGCAGGLDFAFGDLIEGNLAVTGQEDYYRFQGTKGQVLWIDINAQDTDQVSFDPDYIDTTVTLFDANETKVAQNDNPIEFSSTDSRLYTIIPADGDYCVRVADCWTVKNNPGSACLGTAEKLSTAYELQVFELVDDGTMDGTVADPETGNDAASAVSVDFVAAQDAGSYFTTYVWGYYETVDDVDVYKLSLPPDLAVPLGSRPSASITGFTQGPSGTGSTIQTGELVIVDPASPDVAFARLDPTKSSSLRAPLPLDKEYLLFVNRPQATAKANDFYFLSTFPGWGNPIEMDDVANTDMATPEAIDLSDAASAYIEGDLLPITDVDHFQVTVPNGMTTVTGVCGGRTQGSGLRQMKLSLYGDDGKLLSAGSTDIETESQLALVSDAPLGNYASIVVKIEAPMQAADATSGYYQCGIHFN